ncbi:MAG: TetR/AcrR family transcriptional regulator [Proteobacteria bacterium]|nr:TetR/AcrR family transcriptional regulator [Pseudomonadota bacterium]
MTAIRKTLGLRRNLKEEQRRSQIKEAAINLFSQKGYDQATMDDLVIEAGISKSLIYWYWKSKSALLSELIDTCMTTYTDLLQAGVASDEPYLQKLNRLIWEFTETFKKNDRLNKLVHFCSLHHPKNPDENFGEQVNTYYQEVLSLIETILTQGIEEGAIKNDVDTKALSLLLLTAVEGFIYMSILEERPPVERILLTTCFKYLLPGVMADQNLKKKEL